MSKYITPIYSLQKIIKNNLHGDLLNRHWS